MDVGQKQKIKALLASDMQVAGLCQKLFANPCVAFGFTNLSFINSSLLHWTRRVTLQENCQQHHLSAIPKSAARLTPLARRTMQSINNDTVIYGNQINNV